MTSEIRQRKGVTAAAAAAAATSTTSVDPVSSKTKLRVVIVGGGPAGAATALSLMKYHSDRVEVSLFDAYPHPSNVKKDSVKKAYAISIGKRGYSSLEQATGLSHTNFPGGILCHHLGRHPAVATTTPGSKKTMKRDPPALVVPRHRLAGHLLDQAKAVGVQVHLEHSLQDLNVLQKVATLSSGGVAKEFNYDLLIGADGSNSKVRTLLNEKVDDFSVERSEVDSMEYQVLTLPGTAFSEYPPDTVHAWNNKEYNSIMLAFPMVAEGSQGHEMDKFRCALVFPEGKFDDFKKEPAALQTAIRKVLPDLTEALYEDIQNQVLAGQTANGGACVWTSSLVSKSAHIALVGDSGHGMWPSLGQGCICALETANIFCQTFKDWIETTTNSNLDLKNELSTLLDEFDRRRHKDARAAVDLTYGGIGAKTSRGRDNSPLSYKLQIAGMMLLNKLTMGLVPKPALLRLMAGDSLSYSTARQFNFYYEKIIVSTSALLLTVGAAMAVTYGFKK